MAVDNFARALAAKAIAGGGGGGTSNYDILSNKPIINQDLSETGFVPSSNTYYRHTGSTETFTNGIIYRFDGTGYEAVGDCPIKSISAGGVALAADENGNVDVPMAQNGISGLVKINEARGIRINNGDIATFPAIESIISSDRLQATGNTMYRPITSFYLDYAVKAAMCDGKGAAWTEAEQKAACARAGAVYDGQFELIEEITLTEDTNLIERSAEPNGAAYNFDNVMIMVEANTGSGDSTLRCRIAELNGSITHLCSLANGISTQKKFSVFYTENICGKLSLSGVCAPGDKSSAYSNCGNVYKSLAFSSDTKIGKLYLLASSSGSVAIPSGTKITIYGVRA